MTDGDVDPTDLSDVYERLYSVPPEDFVDVRSDLAAAARADGDRTRAQRVAALRKPTAAAAVVNRQVLDDPTVPVRLGEIGDRLRAAQGSADGIDRGLLRELSAERRALVQDMADRALQTFGTTVGTTVRDEVIETFDAAVADPEVAGRLGRLTHSEQWSGLGVATGSSSAPGRPARARRPSAEVTAAEEKLSAAQSDLDVADDRMSAARAHVGELSEQLARLQRELDSAEKDAQAAARAERAARSRQRAARSARDRAARGDQG